MRKFSNDLCRLLLYVDLEEELLVFVFEVLGVRGVVAPPLWLPVLVDPRLVDVLLVPLWVCAPRAHASDRPMRILSM